MAGGVRSRIDLALYSAKALGLLRWDEISSLQGAVLLGQRSEGAVLNEWLPKVHDAATAVTPVAATSSSSRAPPAVAPSSPTPNGGSNQGVSPASVPRADSNLVHGHGSSFADATVPS